MSSVEELLIESNVVTFDAFSLAAKTSHLDVE